MRHTAKQMTFLLICLSILTLTGCKAVKNSREYAYNGSSVDQILSEQVERSDSESHDTASMDRDTEVTADSEKVGGEENFPAESNLKVDYDLTAMSSDMVYAMVYQMMVDPDTYIGKTFRMDGLYYSAYYEPTAQYYHCCIIQDATACCAQGLEFVWGDGSHIYPDEYPKANAEIIVQGVFETYKDEGDDNLYCRLKDAALEVMND